MQYLGKNCWAASKVFLSTQSKLDSMHCSRPSQHGSITTLETCNLKENWGKQAMDYSGLANWIAHKKVWGIRVLT